MDSFTKTPRFIYESHEENSFSGTLQIHVHHARNIHNICIYENQDVYAKFSLTYNPDQTFSTRVIHGGGKNPEFNEDLVLKIIQPDAVLKCEIWMMSRAKCYMDDQLLGFALVPISSVLGKGKITQNYDLSSTDLFHSPAGTIKLSLSLATTALVKSPEVPFSDSSETSELLVDKKVSEDYSRVEFPDVNVVNENQRMVSEYFAKNGTVFRPWLEKPDGSFLHLGAAPNEVVVEDYEMVGNSSDESISASPDGSVQNSGFMSSTMTSLSDDRNSADSMEKKGRTFPDFSISTSDSALIVAETSSLKKKSESRADNEGKCLEESSNDIEAKKVPGNLARNAEESAMQQHIVDMYMRSMQQFTESLAKMKLPMDLDKVQVEDDHGNLVQSSDEKIEVDKKKKDNSRVFYGSRAFF